MLTLAQAKEIANSEIKEMQKSCRDFELVIVEDFIIEKPYAYIFSYTSKQYLETNDTSFAIAGNSPLFVSKVDGQISTYRTGLGIDGMISAYEEENDSWDLWLSDIDLDAKRLIVIRKIFGWTMSKLTDFKCKKTLLLESGAKTKLVELQNKLAVEKIKTDLVIRSLA